MYDLKAYSSDYDEHVILREYTINQPKDEILKDIYSSGADVVCFSCYIWNISFVRELIRDLVKILPKTAFWAGGPEVSYDAEKFLTEMPEMTGVMVGEGEKTFHDLLEFYIDGKDSLEEISGIAYRTGDKIIHNGWRELMDLSAIPFVYEHLEKFENRIIYYESSRGCPFSCSYCLSSIDKKLRFPGFGTGSKKNSVFPGHRVPQVKFVDRTFNCKHEHAMTIWKYILEHDNGVTNFHFEISCRSPSRGRDGADVTDAPWTDSAGNRCAVNESGDDSGYSPTYGSEKTGTLCKQSSQFPKYPSAPGSDCRASV